MTTSKTFAKMDISVPIKVWSEKPFVMHSELAKGVSSVDGEPFEVWQTTGGAVMYVNHGGKSYEVGVREVVAAIFDKVKADEQEQSKD